VTRSAGYPHARAGSRPDGTAQRWSTFGVFPDDLERASGLLDDWPGRDAIIEDEDNEPPPAAPRPASKAPQSTSPIGVVLVVAALAAMVAGWMLSAAR
jgi:hypothetical protein